jgi:hypothetical protein
LPFASLSAMMMILAIYVAISVIFSVGFVAGAWWASRARFDDSCCMEVDANRNHDHVSGSETASVYRLHPVPISVANAAVNSLRH